MINDAVNGGLPMQLTTKQPKATTLSAASPSAPVADPAESTQQDKKETAPALSDLQQAVSKLNDYVQNIQRKLSFSVSAETGRTIIKVYDAETDELIRQIPPEETIKLAEGLDTQGNGLFVQEQA